MRGQSHEVDAQGHLVAERYDNDGDGTYTSAQDEVWTYTYDAAGNEIEAQHDGFGGAPDGVWDTRVVKTYDAAGHLLVQDTMNAANTLLERITWTYDAAGNQVSQEEDLDGDGVIVEGWTRTFDAAGNMTEERFIHAGVATEIYAYTWSGSLQTGYSFDTNGDGTPDQSSVTTYDAFGRAVHTEDDDDGDGVVDTTTATSYTCEP